MPWYSASNNSSAPKTVTPFIVPIRERFEDSDLYILKGFSRQMNKRLCSKASGNGTVYSFCVRAFRASQFTSGIISFQPAFPRNLSVLEKNSATGG